MIVRCATSNPGKLREFRLAGERFAPGIVEIHPLDDLKSIDPPEETGSTFEDNAVAKTLYYAARTPDWIFADDSGLEVDALNGEPGVYSARYAGPGANDEANNELVLEKLRGAADRSAQFVCIVALAHRGRLVQTFRGAVRGTIVDSPRGANGFGYDPLFFYEPFGCTFAETPLDAKMGVSHRGQALEQMFRFLRKES